MKALPAGDTKTLEGSLSGYVRLPAIDEAVAAEEVRTVEEAIDLARRLNSELDKNRRNKTAGAA